MFFPVYVIFSDYLSTFIKMLRPTTVGTVGMYLPHSFGSPYHLLTVCCRVDFIHYPPLSNEWIQQVSARVGVRAEYAEVLTLSTSECDYIWRQCLSRGN